MTGFDREMPGSAAKPHPTIEEQERAWFAYVEACKRRDATMSFEDCATAARAWTVFQTLFLADDVKPARPIRRPRNVVIFPVHKTRAPSLKADGAA